MKPLVHDTPEHQRRQSAPRRVKNRLHRSQRIGEQCRGDNGIRHKTEAGDANILIAVYYESISSATFDNRSVNRSPSGPRQSCVRRRFFHGDTTRQWQ
jgi:hypothetical protein